MVGLLANPKMIEYIGVGHTASLPGFPSVFHGGSWTLFRWQLEAGLWVILFSGAMTFVLLKLVGIFLPLRLSDAELEEGDHAIHGNEVYPSDVPTLGGPPTPGWTPTPPQPAVSA
jgi:Amt family ammonium transporter